MKADLATSIIAAIAGVIISYFVCNLLIGPIDNAQVKTVDTTVDANVDEPSPEVFNYKALNPTVEVYVGSCDGQVNAAGECIEGTATNGDTP